MSTSKTDQRTKKDPVPYHKVKRIMQRDEEVGKIAVESPFLVCKATEMFLVALVMSGMEIANERGSTRICDIDLKKTIESNQCYDFLVELVKNVIEKPSFKKKSK
eukprot:GHVP01028615.1.p2 GENE.GHVP01028615.1~~GHVP01028615.1.p2  ORF type:complete len:105 (+),score=23.26 GHVP01028615.1:770-1084(+)